MNLQIYIIVWTFGLVMIHESTYWLDVSSSVLVFRKKMSSTVLKGTRL